MGNVPYVRSLGSAVPSVVRPREVAANQIEGAHMPRYMVERTFPQGLDIPINDDGAKACGAVVEANSAEGVTWVHSYVTTDKHKTYCIYDGPSPEAIRQVAATNGLPVDGIVEVSVLDPYFYR
jgi:hypothetical protein